MYDSTVTDPAALTPWEERNGIWYKREDAHRNVYGVNGAKYRAARHLMERAVAAGANHVVSASSVLSPQAAISATLAEEMGLECTIVVGASRPETAVKHPSVAIAVEAGATLNCEARVAYNPYIQKFGLSVTESTPNGWQMPYGITTKENASEKELEAFLAVGGVQVANTPDQVKTLVIPFGSGNTTAGVLYGLATDGAWNVERVVLVGVGPDRYEWLFSRLGRVGIEERDLPFQVDHMPLHPWFAEYGDRMPETLDGIVLHPTYEGKVARFLNTAQPDWWTARDDSVGFWIVGGPVG